MIDPIISLATTLRSNKGIYALILGSGVSKSSGIPTGWEIILELTQKLAHAMGKNCDPSPAEWYKTEFGKDPSYSELLDALAGTPAERSAIIKTFFEPTNEERLLGIKQPSEAHHAIAELVSRGYIKVILTTNFDRLMEQALTESGVSFDVVASPDDLGGCPPLVHSECTLIKLHGDYQDLRTKNTPDELASYHPSIDSILDRIFDEYGIITAGWSGTWDTALKTAFLRCKSKRYSTYWSCISDPNPEANILIGHRNAKIISIVDSDSFFAELREKVFSLEEYDQNPQTVSLQFALAALKRYLPDPSSRIRLHDLISSETERSFHTIQAKKFSVGGGIDKQAFQTRVQDYFAAVETLSVLFAHAYYWNIQDVGPWTRSLERLSHVTPGGGSISLLNLRHFPGQAIFYSAGIGAIASGNFGQLAQLIRNCNIRSNDGKLKSPIECFASFSVFDGNASTLLEGVENQALPFSKWMKQKLRPIFQNLIPDEKTYSDAFDRFEYFLGLTFAYDTQSDFAPVGVFALSGGFMSSPEIIDITDREISLHGKKWPPYSSGLYLDLERFQIAKVAFDKRVKMVAFQIR